MKICFLVLAHEQPELCARLIQRLLDGKSMVAVHLDSKASPDFRKILQDDLGERYENILWADSVSVGWGEWSMVEATLNGLRAIRDSGQSPDYIYLLSGADYPIRPLPQLQEFLARNKGREFVESVNAEHFKWVTRGLQQDRYRYRHPVSWKKHPFIFDQLLRLQRLLGLKREFPRGHTPHMGSQWWTLTWTSCQAILELVRDKKLVKFFKSTWVPDELFFQSMIRSVVADDSLVDGRHLTLYQFSDYGVPLVYCNGHEDYLQRQPFFFARKISPHASGLRDALDTQIVQPGSTPADEEVGQVPSDYARHIEHYAQGLEGRRIMCKPDDELMGSLAWNQHHYFVLVSESRQVLATAAKIINELPRSLCHGELLGLDRIGFADNKTEYCGYRQDDLEIRDQSPQNFLVDIIQASPGHRTGFSFCSVVPGTHLANKDSDEPVDMLDVLADDPNALLIRLDSDDQESLATRLETLLGALQPESPPE